MKLIIITGPTACGKTSIATRLASDLSGEIISADSRQIYKGMDIGTGKDLYEYTINNVKIPYHLINILEPKDNYSVLLGPENKKRIDELSKILGNLKYKNFHLVAYKGILENKKKENTNFLTIDPKDFNLPHVDEKKISPPSK